MSRSLRWVFSSLLLVSMHSACASGFRAGPPNPSASLERAEWVTWHSLRHVLLREDVRTAEAAAICVGLGEDGGGVPSPKLLEDFAGVEPPVVSVARCSSADGGGWKVSGAGAGPATMVSFFDLGESGSLSVSVRIEIPGQPPMIERCRLSVPPERRTIGNASRRAEPTDVRGRTGTSSSPPRVEGC